MRQILLVPVLLCACVGSGAKADAATLTAADVTGTYTGSTMAGTTDSVITTWTVWVTTNAAGELEGKLVDHAAPNDTVAFSQTISGDSVTSKSVAYTPTGAPAGSPQLHWVSVARGAGNDWTGSLTVMLTGTDSVVQLAHWKGTRTP